MNMDSPTCEEIHGQYGIHCWLIPEEWLRMKRECDGAQRPMETFEEGLCTHYQSL